MARQMKDSGIEWIGEIPETWNQIRLKYCCSVLNGFPFDSKNFTLTEGFPLIRIRDITSGCTETRYNGPFDSAFVVNNGDLLVGMDGDFNIRLWDGGMALLNQRCCKLIEEQGITRQFLFYYLPFRLKWVNDLTYATTVKHLSSGDIVETALFVPSIAEQRRIADFLDRKCAEIDAVIERTKATIEEYKKLKQAVITEAVTKGVRGPRPMKDSGIEWIGEIPEAWEVAPLKYFITDYKAGPFGSSLITDKLNSSGTILVYTPEHVAKKTAELEFNLYLPDERREEMQQFVVTPGDIIFPIVGSLGRSMLVTDDMPMGIINQRLAKFRLSASTLEIEYFLWLFSKSSFYNTYIDLNCRGSIIVNLTKQIVYDMPVPHPMNLSEQAEIVAYLNEKCAALDTLITKKIALLTELETYKKSLIYEYVTGKKEV